jgi:hypothetical protein
MALVGLMLVLAGPAAADFNVVDHTTHKQNGATGLVVDDQGNLKIADAVRDRDFPLLTQMFSGQVLPAGATYSMTQAKSMSQYSLGAIMLTWAVSAADTDSVRLAVRVYGTKSIDGGNYYLWTLGGLSVSDSCFGTGYIGADTTATSPSRCLAPLTWWIQKNYGYNPQPRTTFLAENVTTGGAIKPAAGQIVVRKIPLSIMRFCSANGVMLPLTDNYGAQCPFPYIRIEVTNMGRQQLSGVEAVLWPRVQ